MIFQICQQHEYSGHLVAVRVKRGGGGKEVVRNKCDQQLQGQYRHVHARGTFAEKLVDQNTGVLSRVQAKTRQRGSSAGHIAEVMV